MGSAKPPPRWEQLALAGLLALAAAAWLAWGRLPLAVQVLFWVAWLSVLIAVLRGPFARLVGPVFFFDLVRASRRARPFWLRALYGCALLAALLWFFARWFPEWDGTPQGLWETRTLPPREV